MSIFGSMSGNQPSRGSIFPDERYRAARKEREAAEEAFAAAQVRVTKARLAYNEAWREYDQFYNPKQQGEQ